MLKILGSILILGAFTSIGMSQKNQYKRRVKVLQALLSSLDMISGELSFRLSSIPEVVSLLTKSQNAGVSALFLQLQHALSDDNGLSLSYKWMRAFQKYGEDIGMNKDDIAVMCDMSDFIGKYDVKSQQDCIEYARKRLENQLKQAEMDVKSKGTVYRTCCIAAGALLVLVLI